MTSSHNVKVTSYHNFYIAVKKGKWFNYVKNQVLDVRTCSEKGSNDQMRVLFSDAGKQNVGGFLVKFEGTLKYQFIGCSDSWTNINSNKCKKNVAREWNFDHKGNIMIVKCNGELVIKFNLKNKMNATEDVI